MSSETTLSEFAKETETPTRERDATRRPQWAQESVHCQCGADIGEWHPPAEARRLARMYADQTGCVPACPNCAHEHNHKANPAGVAKAVKYLDSGASTEPMDAERKMDVLLRDGVEL